MVSLEQYVGSAEKFNSSFRIHKSGIKTKKDRSGATKHFNNKYYHSSNSFIYTCGQLIGKIYCIFDDCNPFEIFYDAEKNIGNPNYLQM